MVQHLYPRSVFWKTCSGSSRTIPGMPTNSSAGDWTIRLRGFRGGSGRGPASAGLRRLTLLPPARRALYLGALLIALIGVSSCSAGSRLWTCRSARPSSTYRCWCQPGPTGPSRSCQPADGEPARAAGSGGSVVSQGRAGSRARDPAGDAAGGTYTSGDIEICGATRPANTVGGDFYDVLPLPDGRVILSRSATWPGRAALGAPDGAAGDAANAGRRGARAGAADRARTRRSAGTAPARASSRSSMRFTTRRPALTYVNAGQNPPLIRRGPGATSGSPPPASRSDVRSVGVFSAVETRIDPGEMLVLYSDGITEAENPAGSRSRKPGCR